MSVPPPTQQPPSSLKPVSHYLKVALEHDTRDQVISYWARFAAVQKSLSIDKSSPEAKLFVIGLLEWLEKAKRANAGNEAISVEAAGEAHIENYALKLFSWADASDRGAVFNKNVVKAFYTAGILFDILESLRPPLSDEFTSARKYAKWKAAYIHNCLKNGETPVPGGTEDGDEEEDGDSNNVVGGASSFGFVNPQQPYQQPYQQPQPDMNNTIPQPPRQQPSQDFPNYDFVSHQAPPAGGGGYNFTPHHEQVPSPQQPAATTAGALSFEQIAKAQKYCKWAGSALNFDDVGSAVENLEKALHLLKTGQDLG